MPYTILNNLYDYGSEVATKSWLIIILLLNFTGQFPKHSSIACLNISNNNLSSATLQPSIQRPFAYLFTLTVLDASANNLTEFPLSLVQSNRKISVDLSGEEFIIFYVFFSCTVYPAHSTIRRRNLIT